VGDDSVAVDDEVHIWGAEKEPIQVLDLAACMGPIAYGSGSGDGPRQHIGIKAKLLLGRAEIPPISHFLRSKISI
jgi:hypothetical protein